MLDGIFDRVCVINLAHRADRRRETEAVLAQLGCRVDGHRVRFHPAVRPEAAGAFPSVGARGCFLSHLAVLRDAARDGLGSVLVLEDDVAFAPNAVAVLQTLPAALSQGGVGMVYGFPPQAAEDDNGLDALPSRFVAVLPDRGILRTHMVGFFGGAIGNAVGYLDAMAARPAGSTEGGPMHVDGAYSWFRQSRPSMTTLAAVPAIAIQRASRSDIAALSWYDRTPLLRTAASLARRLRRGLPVR